MSEKLEILKTVITLQDTNIDGEGPVHRVGFRFHVSDGQEYGSEFVVDDRDMNWDQDRAELMARVFAYGEELLVKLEEKGTTVKMPVPS